MCDALRELMREEIEEEKRNAVQSIVQETEQTILEIIKSLMNLTADQAMSAMNFSVEKQAEYRAKL